VKNCALSLPKVFLLQNQKDNFDTYIVNGMLTFF